MTKSVRFLTRARLHVLTFCMAMIALVAVPQEASAVSSTIVIAEVYGGGGNSGAPYLNDYVVLFNRGGTSVDVNGWSIQYASATGTNWSVGTIATTSTFIPAGGYFLIKLGGSTNGVALPASDASATGINMSGTVGKVALVSNNTALTGSCPTGGSIVDFVGFGGTASCFEGTGPTPAPSNSTSVARAGGGCTDTDNNALDFTSGPPTPKNSSTTVSPCGGGAAPSITAQPQAKTGYGGETAVFSVTASGTATLLYQWFKDSTPLSNGGRISGATSSVLTVTNIIAADAAGYSVVITNSYGSATSTVAALTVNDSTPQFVIQPLDRFNLAGTPTVLSATVVGNLPITYRWKKDGVNLVDNGRIVGSATASLTITNVVGGDAGSYTLAATNSAGDSTSSAANLTVGTSGVLAGWEFNNSINTANPVSSQGSSAAVASLVSVTGFSNNVASGNDFGSGNNAWGTSGYPTQGTSNKSAGVQFAVSTVGFKNLAVTFDQRATATASRYTRLQYSTNGTTFIDCPLSLDINPNNLSANLTYQSRTVNLTGFPGAQNNPNFAIRIVTEFESTAKYGATNNANYVANTSSYAASGTVSYDLVKINADAITSNNNPPTISSITNQTTVDTTPVVVNVTINDVETSASSLTLSATSLNPSVLSDSQIVAGGSGSARTLTITPTPGSTGVVPILATVTDGAGDVTTTWFYLTINPGNAAPTVSGLQHTNMIAGSPLTVAFTVTDDHTAAGSLTLSETSFNPALIADSGIVFGGSGSNRTVTFTPVANQTGVAPITISVNDNDALVPKTASFSFTVMVRPNTNIIVNDSFGYLDGAIINQSFGLWQSHSGTAGQMQVASGEVVATTANTEDVNIPLLGQRFSTNTPVVLYSSFKVRFTALPTDGGSYFAHFKDDNTGAATGFGARVWASTSNAVAGAFRLGIANGASATNTSGQFPRDLQLNTNYLVVTKFALSNGLATIWIDPVSETDTNVTATDIGTASRPNAMDVLAYAIRESTSEGIKNIDDLKVGLSFAAVTGIAAPVPLTYQVNGNNVILSWSDSRFKLQSASQVNGTYSDVVGAVSPSTNAITGSQKYYRLKY